MEVNESPPVLIILVIYTKLDLKECCFFDPTSVYEFWYLGYRTQNRIQTCWVLEELKGSFLLENWQL